MSTKPTIYAHFSVAEAARIDEAFNPFGWTKYALMPLVVERFMQIRGRVAGVVLKNFHGACRSRCVGHESDGTPVWTNYLSADMMPEPEHQVRKYAVRALASATDVILITGIPSEAGAAAAAQRIAECGARAVEADVSGQNHGAALAAFADELGRRSIALYGEPLPIGDTEPECMRGRPYLSNFARCQTYMDRHGVLPTGTIVSVTGFRNETDRLMAPLIAGEWMARDWPIAYPEHRLAELQIGSGGVPA